MTKRRVPPHLLPFDDPRFRPLAFIDPGKLPPADQEGFSRALREYTASELLWTWKRGEGRGAKNPGSVREAIRRRLGLPTRPKRRTGKPPGRPQTVGPKQIRDGKRHHLSDAEIARVLGVSRSTIARHKR
jgi:hypothetical protein